MEVVKYNITNAENITNSSFIVLNPWPLWGMYRNNGGHFHCFDSSHTNIMRKWIVQMPKVCFIIALRFICLSLIQIGRLEKLRESKKLNW